jgi:peptidoglycan/LPS O-acetylase OafA/YrhL
MKRILYLDGWRGLAVVCVLFAHFIDNSHINLGRFGVEMFLVLSGRLMAEILFVRNSDLPRFFKRRFSRVYPAMFVFCCLMFASSGWLFSSPNAAQFLSLITLTMNYTTQFIGSSPITEHIWTLCVEEHMYLLLGLIAMLHRLYNFPLVPVLLVLAIIGYLIGLLETAAGFDYYSVYWKSHVRGASVLTGAILYLTFSGRRPDVLSSPWLPILFGMAAVILNTNSVPDPLKYTLGTSALAFSLVLMPHAPSLAMKIFEHPLTLRIGIWSYSIYLWQQPYSKISGDLYHRVIYLSLAVISGIIGFYLVEKPIRVFLNRKIDISVPHIP